MASQNLSKNIHKISLYYNIIDEKIYKDPKFIEMINLVSDQEYQNINYSLYTDAFLLKNNIFIPNFHTLYLASGKHHVIIHEPADSWLQEVFPNNTYYFINTNNIEINNKIKNITSIRDIIKENA